MARIENTSERTFHLSLGSVEREGKRTSQVTVEITAQTKSESGVKTNGFADVDDKALADARKNDPVVKHWFDCGDLVVAAASAPAPAPADKGNDKK